MANIDSLIALRTETMARFLAGFAKGKAEGRYIYHHIPKKLPFVKKNFHLGLSSHFLLLYPQLNWEFHQGAIDEMLRVCQELRIFPIVGLNGKPATLLQPIIEYYQQTHKVSVQKVAYEFQKGANKMLCIAKPSIVSTQKLTQYRQGMLCL